MTTGATERDRAKADRHAAILREAARLFAERGFSGVSLEDLGSAVGVSGPALYRHFANKQALLSSLLIEVSRRLRDGGREVASSSPDALSRLRALVDFHVDFALHQADVIRVQDRDLASLASDSAHEVRRLQREYVEVWIGVLADLHPDRTAGDLRVRAHACFGLINSTPHVLHAHRGATRPAVSDVEARRILADMALAALRA
ncbi:TetR/AcrR family transcriptional regulator [Microbacterium hominis]|uniref:TetR/AcrR family transcriptional regulator n=1 Tax=Microbacterium hominis TaxID=162426 RepID=A0A7D4U4P5_9MICO|nr:TetR/AcrR family transcriptional regulator [Microbacterium hominis]QKJ19565.1 TetR/AcrR family transcriptional regulator [Microbacterium hominis]